ncbi:hypothetical protein FOA52_006798 [Chlamydomonas sp. UWO 241]|nr:hypothetical protein FOA52_006798 [Chlamydomonas sp. UWO 241]
MSSKRLRASGDSDSSPSDANGMLLDPFDWTELVASYKEADTTREMVIKRCRDMQKLSKNAIFSLHRGDLAGADVQIASAEGIARELLPTVDTAPSLRQGSFGSACEEWAEAVIFRTYLAEARVLAWREVSWLTCEEYLGGLLDFSGELGRLAVAKATERDEAAVSTYLSLLDDMCARMLTLDPRHPALRKKQGPLLGTVSKVQRLVYELSLSRGLALMGARMKATVTTRPSGEQAGGGGDGGDGEA